MYLQFFFVFIFFPFIVRCFLCVWEVLRDNTKCVPFIVSSNNCQLPFWLFFSNSAGGGDSWESSGDEDANMFGSKSKVGFPAVNECEWNQVRLELCNILEHGTDSVLLLKGFLSQNPREAVYKVLATTKMPREQNFSANFNYLTKSCQTPNLYSLLRNFQGSYGASLSIFF